MQLTIKKDIVDIKLRDRPVASKYHNEKCAKSGHVGHIYRSKCLFVVMTMFSPLNELYNTQEYHQS